MKNTETIPIQESETTNNDQNPWLKMTDETPSFINETSDRLEPEKEPERNLSLSEIRKMHIDYLKGTYDPSSEDWDLILTDDDFYESDEYNSYRSQEIAIIASQHVEIYAPSDESIERTIEPFIELIKHDINKLLEIGSELENRLSRYNILKAIYFFAEKYDIQDIPSLILTYEDGVCSSYNEYLNRITIKINKTNSTAEYIGTIAHEMWHAYQYQHADENASYEINEKYYYSSSMDYDAYMKQLIEKEAFAIGDAIGNLYRMADLETHPEKISNLKKKYFEWLSGKYKPIETEDGIDYKYLVLAHHEFSRPGRFKKRILDIFKKLFRGKEK